MSAPHTDEEMERITERLRRAIDDGCEADVRAALEAAGDCAEEAVEGMLFPCVQRVCKHKHERGAVRVLELVGAHASCEEAHRAAREAVELGERAALAVIMSKWDVHATALTLDARDDAMLLHLSDLGADINALVLGRAPLHCAASDGDAARVALLVSLGANVDVKDGDKRSPLHYAVWNRHAATVRVLLEAGANANQSARDGFTPLHWAAMCGDVEIAYALLAAGAQIDKLDRRVGFFSPLLLALTRANVEVAALFIRCGCVWTDGALTGSTMRERLDDSTVVAATHLRDRIAPTSHRACALVSTLQRAHRDVTIVRVANNHRKWADARTSKHGPMSTAQSDYDTDSADEHEPDDEGW